MLGFDNYLSKGDEVVIIFYSNAVFKYHRHNNDLLPLAKCGKPQ